eukprot:1225666-Amorphochlora_amoeboformis.AAC.2
MSQFRSGTRRDPRLLLFGSQRPPIETIKASLEGESDEAIYPCMYRAIYAAECVDLTEIGNKLAVADDMPSLREK